MSTAFAFPCRDNNHQVSIVGTHLEDSFIDIIKANKNTHPILKSKIPNNVKIYKFSNFHNLLKHTDLIVLGVSSKGIHWASEQLTSIRNNQQILILTKGLHVNKKNHYEVYPDTIKNFLLKKEIKNLKISVAAGPCLASDLSNKVLTNVIFANRDISIVRNLSKILSTSYYNIKYSNDVKGVAACGGIKNIYAMIVGTSMGKKQKSYSADIKARVALEAMRSQKTVSQIASEYQVHPTQVNQWKKQAMETIRSGFSSRKEQAVSDEKKIDNLYRQIGKLQVENDFLKQAVYPGTAS